MKFCFEVNITWKKKKKKEKNEKIYTMFPDQIYIFQVL